MESNKFAIIVQGPLNETSLKVLQNYRKYGDVILSYWSTDDNLLLEMFDLNGIKIIVNENVHPNYYKFPDFRIHQLQTTYNALDDKYLYSIKLRSDERYENLEPIINKFLNNTEKLVTNNIFFKKCDETYKYHVSDHLMIFKTEYMKAGLKMLFDDLGVDSEFPNTHFRGMNLSCEMLFSLSFLRKKLKMSVEELMLHTNPREVMLHNFDVMDVNLLGDYIVRWGQKNIIYNKEFPYCLKNCGKEEFQVTNIEDI